MTDDQPLSDAPPEVLQAEEQEQAAVRREDEYPFWSYQDVLVLACLAVPALFLAFVNSQGTFFLLRITPPRAVVPLVSQFLGYGFWFAFLFMMFRFRYARPFWESLAWVKPQHGMVASIFAGPMLAFTVAILGVLLRTPEIEMPFRDLLADRVSILLLGIFATTLGPLCEELAFRGFLMPLLMRSFGVVAGIVLTSLPFALLHGPQYGWSWRHILLLTLAASAFGWMRYKTGSTATATVMHATYNLTFFTAFLLQGRNLHV